MALDFDKAFDFNNPISRFGMLTTYFVVGSLAALMCLFLTWTTLKTSIELIYKIALSGLYCWMFGYNVAYKNLKNWWVLYKLKPKEDNKDGHIQTTKTSR